MKKSHLTDGKMITVLKQTRGDSRPKCSPCDAGPTTLPTRNPPASNARPDAG